MKQCITKHEFFSCRHCTSLNVTEKQVQQINQEQEQHNLVKSEDFGYKVLQIFWMDGFSPRMMPSATLWSLIQDLSMSVCVCCHLESTILLLLIAPKNFWQNSLVQWISVG